jgi:hypothetical protein
METFDFFCSVNRAWAAAVKRRLQEVELPPARFPIEGRGEVSVMKEEGDFDFDFKKSKNLPRVFLLEGRGKVSVMKVEGDF